LSKETERLVKELKEELHALRIEVKQKKNPKLSKTYQELLFTLK
jgi:hypothetical protein